MTWSRLLATVRRWASQLAAAVAAIFGVLSIFAFADSRFYLGCVWAVVAGANAMLCVSWRRRQEVEEK